jgi:PPM family protein phosphatase
VLTLVLLQNGTLTAGHVGDTRLYKMRAGTLRKLTHDHSPIGEREDRGELTESEAMRHPRRNEVYRDVGSEPHQPDDPEFVDVERVPFEPDSALLLCSDGLTDLVPSDSIHAIVKRLAGDPQAIVHALVTAANDAGGKDNVTVVYVEGEEFAGNARGGPLDPVAEPSSVPPHTSPTAPDEEASERGALMVLTLLLVVLGLVVSIMRGWLPLPAAAPAILAPPLADSQVVRPGESITEAIERARPGSQVIVEPGEYREQMRLKDNVRVVSRVPRGATIRLSATSSEAEPAVFAAGLSAVELVGFRIVGDAATPLGVGVFVRDSSISISDVEVTGATKVAIDISGRLPVGLVGSTIHDNPGAALAIRAGATPRISHNAFVRNSLSERASMPLLIERGARPDFEWNVFYGIRADAFPTLDQQARRALARDNWFIALSAQPSHPVASVAGARQGR